MDTTVVVAAASPWHELHEVARRGLGRRPYLPAHCGLEAYATLTRLPEPFRAPADAVVAYLEARFGGRLLAPTAGLVAALPSRLADAGITGGATYDGLVAATAVEHGATLRTLDVRAESTYRRLGARYELLGTLR